MKYALGHAFTLSNLVENLPYKKLSITCKQCYKITKDNHRQTLAKRIFRESLKLVIDDIVNNNVTFWLPTCSSVKCKMCIRRVQGNDFKNLRKFGKWKDVDILKSMFSGYEISFYMLGKRTPRIKPVYVNKQYRDIITKNTNNGMSYGDSKNDTTIKDYYEQIYLLFPEVPKHDIKIILNYTWKSLYLHNSYGGDVITHDKEFWCYFGRIRKNGLEHFFYYIKKLTVKLRVLFKRKKIQWDGYYYFALSDKQYQDYIKQKKQRGRPRKYFKFKNIFIYQIFDECRITEYYKKYIFRISYVSQLKPRYFLRDIITDKAELILTREPLKFKDIRVIDNKYEFL